MENKNELMIFENEEFGKVRTVEENGKVLFCGSDVAKALGYAKPRNAIQAHCKGALKRGILTNGGNQEMSFITEGDVYRLIVHSKLPTAQKFESWVFDEVLPTIRKTGGYINSAEQMVNTYFGNVSADQKVLISGLLTNIQNQQKKIDLLDIENDLLTQKNLQWADRSLINSLVRKYASHCHLDFAIGWVNYKKELLYKYGINLNTRMTNYFNSTGKKPKTLDMINDQELQNAVSTAVSLCHNNNVDIDDILQHKQIVS